MTDLEEAVYRQLHHALRFPDQTSSMDARYLLGLEDKVTPDTWSWEDIKLVCQQYGEHRRRQSYYVAFTREEWIAMAAKRVGEALVCQWLLEWEDTDGGP